MPVQQLREKVKSHNSCRLFYAVLLVTLFQRPLIAEEINSLCATNGEAVDAQQSESEYHVVESKLKLLQNIVYESSTAKRIEASDNTKAVALLKLAREALALSNKLIEQGCISTTEQSLNDGLQYFQTASRYVVDSRRAENVADKTYEQLAERLDTFRKVYERVQRDKGKDKVNILDENQLQSLTNTAENLARKKDYMQANIAMRKAVNMIESALTLALDKETIVHELKFDSIEDEYAYLMETNNSYKKLLNTVLENLDASNSKHASLAKLLKMNEVLLSESSVNAASGKMEKALANLEEGNITLIHALSFIGFGQ